MTTNRRAMLLAFGMLGMGLVFGVAFCTLPACGAVVSPYGDLINRIAPEERLVTDMVSAVNFDYRGFDTLGEEFILFTSVMGVSLLLRKLKDDRKTAQPGRIDGRESHGPGCEQRGSKFCVHLPACGLLPAPAES